MTLRESLADSGLAAINVLLLFSENFRKIYRKIIANTTCKLTFAKMVVSLR